MNILVTGAKGFVGRNLVENLYNIKLNKNITRPNLIIDDIYEYDLDSEAAMLDVYCKKADFVFNLAGVNRPKDVSEFMQGNCDFAEGLLKKLEKYKNKAPVMLSSSIQATLSGRFKNSDYGMSKLAGEKLFFSYGARTGVKVLVYRLPNLFGKWCKPNYNSVVATFCNAVANDLEYTVNNYNEQIELLYIDDLVEEMLDALEGKEHFEAGVCEGGRDKERFCYVPLTYKVTLGEIVGLLESFRKQSESRIMSDIPAGSFEKKLYSTYLSYLPERKVKIGLNMNKDSRGSFAEFMRTDNCGQISLNIIKPAAIKGQHWHNFKWEMFIVVSGHGLIQQRKIGKDPNTGRPYEIMEFEVSGDKLEVVYILPGYTHNIINLSDSENLVAVIWANEPFNPEYPDTYRENIV